MRSPPCRCAASPSMRRASASPWARGVGGGVRAMQSDDASVAHLAAVQRAACGLQLGGIRAAPLKSMRRLI